MQTIDEALEKLEKSEFRSKFCLDEKEKESKQESDKCDSNCL